MILSALRTAVERRSGVAFDPLATTEAINEALFAISSERDWPWLITDWLFSTVADDATTAAPATTRRVVTVAVNGSLIPMVPASMLDNNVNEVGWVFRAGVLTLSPTPTSVQSVVARVVRNEAALVADGDSPLMPAEWQQGALVNYAASILLERVDELARADRCMARYNDAKRRMISQAANVKGPHRVRVRPGSML